MDKLTKLTDFLKRLKTESPEFFKKFQVFSWLGTAISAALLILDLTGVYMLPGVWPEVVEVLMATFFGASVTSHLPVKAADDDGPGPGGEPPKPPGSTKP